MSKKAVSYITLILFINFLTSCKMMSPSHHFEVIETSSPMMFEATKLHEVELMTVSDQTHRGKLIRFEGENLFLLPFPYWNVDLIEIGIDDIRSVLLLGQKGNVGKGFIVGFSVGFMLTGGLLLAGGSLKYNEDYEEAITASLLSGLSIALLVSSIGGIASLGKKSKYNFLKMSRSEKINALRKIMR